MVEPEQKDLEPEIELQDDEEALPADEEVVDDGAPPSTDTLGRTAIARFAQLAPAAPGVYRMIDAKGDVLYVGKAKNIRKRIIAYGLSLIHI